MDRSMTKSNRNMSLSIWCVESYFVRVYQKLYKKVQYLYCSRIKVSVIRRVYRGKKIIVIFCTAFILFLFLFHFALSYSHVFPLGPCLFSWRLLPIFSLVAPLSFLFVSSLFTKLSRSTRLALSLSINFSLLTYHNGIELDEF